MEAILRRIIGMNFKFASDKAETVSPDILASYIETLSLHRGRYRDSMSKELVRLIDNLPPNINIRLVEHLPSFNVFETFILL